jgi:hypothetical protein
MRLRSYCRSFKTPPHNPSEEDSIILGQSIADRCLDSIDVIVNEIATGYEENSSYWTYILLSRIDDNFTNPDTFESEWSDMEEGISSDMRNFLNGTEIISESTVADGGLMSFCLAVETPFDEIDEEKLDNLIDSIESKYNINKDSILSHEIVQKEFPNLNLVWSYVLLVKPYREIKENWKEVTDGIFTDINEFFKDTTVYQILFDDRNKIGGAIIDGK